MENFEFDKLFKLSNLTLSALEPDRPSEQK